MSTGPLDINASIVGNVVELRYSSHSEAFSSLWAIRNALNHKDELLSLVQEAVDRGPIGADDWCKRARAAIAAATGEQT